MIAVYDLARSPPTYDFAIFLANAERERVRRDDPALEIMLAPGPNNGFRQDGLWPPIAQREAMLQQVVIPMAWLLPSVKAVRRETPARHEFGVGEALFGLRLQAQMLRECIVPLRAPRPKAGRYVTITLREAQHWPQANSNLPAWLELAKVLKAAGERVVFVRDTLQADQPVPGFKTSPAAARDLTERANLYAGARLNLFVNNGPAWLAFFMDTPSLIFKIFSPNAVCRDELFYRESGVPRGTQFGQPHQRIVWEDDNADILIKETLVALDMAPA
jgi:hypothetical protein